MKTLRFLPLLLLALAASPVAFGGDFTLAPNTNNPYTPGAVLPVTGVTGGTALFQAVNLGPSSGTGVLDPFLREHANGTETAYNTSFRNGGAAPLDGDNGASAQFNHDLAFSSLATTLITIGGVPYYQLYLDENQINNANGTPPNNTIDLTRLDIGIGAASQSNNTASGPTFSLLAWSLGGAYPGAAHDITITDVNQGQGRADVLIDIPASAFGAQSPDANVILFATFTNANSAFEEWGLFPGTGIVSTPDNGMTLILLGVALGVTEILRRTLMKRTVAVRSKI